MNLCDYNTIRDLLARHGFHFSKSMGQNFLIDPEVPRRIAEASGADAGCGVLEIGPGIGPLTAELAQRAGKVVAVELDRALLPVLAETIWDRFSSIMQDIYGQVVAISTIVAVTVAAIALIVRMVSRNQRAVDEATSWLKRIVVTWIVLNTLGFIVAYLQPLIAGGQYTGG